MTQPLFDEEYMFERHRVQKDSDLDLVTDMARAG